MCSRKTITLIYFHLVLVIVASRASNIAFKIKRCQYATTFKNGYFGSSDFLYISTRVFCVSLSVEVLFLLFVECNLGCALLHICKDRQVWSDFSSLDLYTRPFGNSELLITLARMELIIYQVIALYKKLCKNYGYGTCIECINFSVHSYWCDRNPYINSAQG